MHYSQVNAIHVELSLDPNKHSAVHIGTIIQTEVTKSSHHLAHYSKGIHNSNLMIYEQGHPLNFKITTALNPPLLIKANRSIDLVYNTSSSAQPFTDGDMIEGHKEEDDGAWTDSDSGFEEEPFSDLYLRD